MAAIDQVHLQFSWVRAVLAKATGLVSNLGLFIGVALLGGIGSSWYMIEHGTRVSTRTAGPWTTWVLSGQPEADPYTRAHFARAGSLPMPTDIARTYEAGRDSDGDRLHSSCEYAVQGEGLDQSWWSLAVFNDRGLLIPNPAERYAFNSRTIARAPDGSYLISLSRDARPGNWLPTTGAGRLVLVLTIQSNRSQRVPDAVEEASLPVIRKVACR